MQHSDPWGTPRPARSISSRPYTDPPTTRRQHLQLHHWWTVWMFPTWVHSVCSSIDEFWVSLDCQHTWFRPLLSLQVQFSRAWHIWWAPPKIFCHSIWPGELRGNVRDATSLACTVKCLKQRQLLTKAKWKCSFRFTLEGRVDQTHQVHVVTKTAAPQWTANKRTESFSANKCSSPEDVRRRWVQTRAGHIREDFLNVNQDESSMSRQVPPVVARTNGNERFFAPRWQNEEIYGAYHGHPGMMLMANCVKKLQKKQITIQFHHVRWCLEKNVFTRNPTHTSAQLN